jgi:hypothetical protein
MLFNLLGAHGKEALVLDAYHRHVRTFLKDHRLTRARDGQERRLSRDESTDTGSSSPPPIDAEPQTQATRINETEETTGRTAQEMSAIQIAGTESLVSKSAVGKLEPEPEPEPHTVEPEPEILLPQASEEMNAMLVPTVSLAPVDEPGMAPGVIQPPSTSGDDFHEYSVGYVAWDYHARTPVEFGTVFKEKALECLGEQSVRS